MTRRVHFLATALLCAAAATSLHGQLSLQSAVNLALKNSPKVRVAQADLAKATASREEARDAYIPVISTQAGYGQATGAPLNVPVIFNIGAQSLVFSFSQRDYMRSASEGVKAAELVLHSTQVEVVEDVTNVYLALDSNLERQQVLRESLGVADRLVTVTTDRIAAGVDAKVELPRSRRTATQLRLAASAGRRRYCRRSTAPGSTYGSAGSVAHDRPKVCPNLCRRWWWQRSGS